jgi:peptide/nickel transport system permease protein
MSTQDGTAVSGVSPVSGEGAQPGEGTRRPGRPPVASEAAGTRPILRRPVLVAASLVVVLVTAAVSGAPLLTSHPPLEQDLLQAFAGPSADHPLGTDSLGRDVLSRLLYGGRPALSGVAIAVGVFALLGLLLGVLSGYLQGWADRVIAPLLDVMLSVPGIIVILAVLAIFEQNVYAAMAVLGLFGSANLARVIRGSCIAIREELFVDAARVSGLGPARIMTRHVLPALVGQTLVQMSLFAGIALGVQTGLGFLGLGTPAPQPSWGGMVGEAAQVMQQHPWFLLAGGGVIGLMTLAFGLVGDGLRDLDADRRRRGTASGTAHAAASVTAPATATPRDTAPAHRDGWDPTALLSVRDYSVAFETGDGFRTVVDSISFTVRPGEVFGLVGESGSGKTVTALSLLGLLPGSVAGGAAWLGERRLAPATERELRELRGHEIGLVTQEPMVALDPHFTIGSQLTEVVRRIGGVQGKAAVRTRALELFADVRLPDPAEVMKRYPHQLSGGMLQRVVIAMALAGSPRLLIADEPTTALDVTVQAGILDLLRTLRDQRRMGVVLVTHDLAVVADICDRAIVMQEGRIVEQGSVDDVFYSPGHPYTQRLIDSTPSIVGSRHA